MQGKNKIEKKNNFSNDPKMVENPTYETLDNRLMQTSSHLSTKEKNPICLFKRDRLINKEISEISESFFILDGYHVTCLLRYFATKSSILFCF